MPEEAKQRLCEKMIQRKEVFSLHEWDVGCSKSTTHEIRLNDSRPFRERSRRLAPADFKDVRLHLQELQSSGIISESRSSWCAKSLGRLECVWTIGRSTNGQNQTCILCPALKMPAIAFREVDGSLFLT